MRVITLPGVYPPSEDTFFLASELEKHPLSGKHLLDMGTGSGYLAVLASLKGAHVLATDINPLALKNVHLNARLNGVRIRTRLSNLFENVQGRFDYIVFNPPYLTPIPEAPDPAWDGGYKIIRAFLEQVGSYLEGNGRYFLIMEEDENWRRLKKQIDCAKVKGNAFHLILLEGQPCP